MIKRVIPYTAYLSLYHQPLHLSVLGTEAGRACSLTNSISVGDPLRYEYRYLYTFSPSLTTCILCTLQNYQVCIDSCIISLRNIQHRMPHTITQFILTFLLNPANTTIPVFNNPLPSARSRRPLFASQALGSPCPATVSRLDIVTIGRPSKQASDWSGKAWHYQLARNGE